MKCHVNMKVLSNIKYDLFGSCFRNYDRESG